MRKTLSWIIISLVTLFVIYSFYRGNIAAAIISVIMVVLFGLYMLGQSEEKKETTDGVPKIDIKRDNKDISVYGNFSKGGLDTEEAKKLMDNILKDSSQDDCSLDFNAAIRIMLDKDYEGGIRAFENLIEKYISLYPKGCYTKKAKKLLVS